MNLSKITAIGEITSAPESRTTQDGKAMLALDIVTATGVPLRCSGWGKLAESAADLKIGDIVLVGGALTIYSQKVEGSQYDKKTFQVQIKELQKLTGSPINVSAGAPSAGYSGPTRDNVSSSSSSSVAHSSEEELPF